MPSRARLTQVSIETVGLRNNLFAESLTRAQCSSRSGATPSNARAPSKTTEHNQAAWVRGPMIGTLPECHLSSKYVQVFDQPPPTAIDSPSLLEHPRSCSSAAMPRAAGLTATAFQNPPAQRFAHSFIHRPLRQLNLRVNNHSLPVGPNPGARLTPPSPT